MWSPGPSQNEGGGSMMKKEEMDKILEIERKLAEAKNGMVEEIAKIGRASLGKEC